MKEKLNAIDRALIPGMLSHKGSRMDLIMTKDIIDTIEFKPEEFKELGITELPDGRLTWDKKKDPNCLIEKEFDLKKPQTAFLKDAVNKMDTDKTMTMIQLETCEKILKFRG